MRKAVARFGDATTTGGKVFASSAKMFDNGRRLALNGENASCGNCEGSYPIFGTGSKMTDRGRSVVVDGDAVLCPCGKNKVVVSGDARVHIDWNGSKKVSHGSTSSFSHAAQALIDFDERFTLIDAATGKPVGGMGYQLMSNGDVVGTGITDSEGKTERIATKDARIVTMRIRSISV